MERTGMTDCAHPNVKIKNWRVVCADCGYEPPRLVVIGTPASWPDGEPERLRASLEDALKNDERILLFRARRDRDGEGTTCTTFNVDDVRRIPCRVSYAEWLGTLYAKLLHWFRQGV